MGIFSLKVVLVNKFQIKVCPVISTVPSLVHEFIILPYLPYEVVTSV
jgi:hypothetical protein